jgi:diguanylate cyclase (GGDEF)-like protein
MNSVISHDFQVEPKPMNKMTRSLMCDPNFQPAIARIAANDVEVQRLTHLLAWAIQYAKKQKQRAVQMRKLALLDELTGLYNRRGFQVLAKQHLKLARRTQCRSFIVFADVNGLKQINDTGGHAEGDHILKETAAVLRDSVRESDIVARLGGDEFVILARDIPDSSSTPISTRLQENLRAHNEQNRKGQAPLSIAFGFLSFGCETLSIEDLLILADQVMYRHKRASHTATRTPSRDQYTAVNWDPPDNGGSAEIQVLSAATSGRP